MLAGSVRSRGQAVAGKQAISTLYFLTQSLKVDSTTTWLLIAGALAIGTPFFVFFGWLSDKIGTPRRS